MIARRLFLFATFLILAGGAPAGILSDAEVKAVLDERLPLKSTAESPVVGIVVNADHEDRLGWHADNVRDFYAAWRNRGWAEEDLFVFATEDVRPDVSATTRFVINGHPTKNNLIQLFGYLRKTSRSRSTYYVYLTGHGRRSGDEVFLTLDDLDLGGSELVRWLRGVQRRGSRFVVIADHCYSGGMIDQMKRSPLDFVCVSSTDATHLVQCRKFTKPFWAAFQQEGISLLEAFQTARAALPVQESESWNATPLYYSSGD